MKKRRDGVMTESASGHREVNPAATGARDGRRRVRRPIAATANPNRAAVGVLSHAARVGSDRGATNRAATSAPGAANLAAIAAGGDRNRLAIANRAVIARHGRGAGSLREIVTAGHGTRSQRAIANAVRGARNQPAIASAGHGARNQPGIASAGLSVANPMGRVRIGDIGRSPRVIGRR